jgi:predicted dithiol-disulfide oxidoreductase (DUF899 family)
MTTHKTGTREQWLKARLELLKAEKELTRRSDEVALKRRELPWVPVNKGYRFEIDKGSASLADLFQGRSQLLVYHFMFGPDFSGGCPSCSSIADGFNGITTHLAHHDVTLWAVSRAPIAKLQVYKHRMGWTFHWASSVGGDFNFDFCASYTEEQQREGGIKYNYRSEAPLRTRGREDGVVYHTYSTYARGLDGLWGMYPWLDRAPKGRNETGLWWRRHDEYNNQNEGRACCGEQAIG